MGVGKVMSDRSCMHIVRLVLMMLNEVMKIFSNCLKRMLMVYRLVALEREGVRGWILLVLYINLFNGKYSYGLVVIVYEMWTHEGIER